jgi:hypothetical protein
MARVHSSGGFDFHVPNPNVGMTFPSFNSCVREISFEYSNKSVVAALIFPAEAFPEEALAEKALVLLLVLLVAAPVMFLCLLPPALVRFKDEYEERPPLLLLIFVVKVSMRGCFDSLMIVFFLCVVSKLFHFFYCLELVFPYFKLTKTMGVTRTKKSTSLKRKRKDGGDDGYAFN